jgi:hypothetical protein
VDELEDLLKRYRPSGPPAELRGRVLGGEPVGRRQGRQSIEPVSRPFQGQRWREWIYPIAAAVAAMTFYALTDSTHRRLNSANSTADEEHEAAVADMTVHLGGGDAARLEAERLIRATESAGVDPQVEGPLVIEESNP